MSKRATSAFRGLRVLVADDEFLISEFIGEVLLHLECTVIGAVRNLDEALRAIRTSEIEGALLDVRLGEESIYLRANELALRRIPFILPIGHRDLGGYPVPVGNAPLLMKPFIVPQPEEMMSGTFRP